MAAVNKFRTALGGFNREDVANFIEMTALEHQKQLRALSEQNERLLKENELLKGALEQVKTELQNAMEGMPTPEELQEIDYPAEELEAYRRAEAAERNAVARAEKVHQQLDEIALQAKQGCESSAEEIAAVSVQIREGLEKLEAQLAALQTIFDEANEKFMQLDT